jgi:hypothetical protein
MSIDFGHKMREAIGFFEENNFSLSDMVTRGKKYGLTEAQVRVGMMRVFDRVNNGEELKPLRYAWAAWDEAKKVQSEAYTAYEMSRAALRKQVEKTKSLLTWASVIGSVGWVAAIMLGIQIYWGVLWQ